MKTLEQLAMEFVKAHTVADEKRIYSQMMELAACEEEVQCFIEEAYEK